MRGGLVAGGGQGAACGEAAVVPQVVEGAAVPDPPLGARQVTAGGNACSRHVGSAASEPVIQARDGGAACFGIATPERCRRTCSRFERDRLTRG